METFFDDINIIDAHVHIPSSDFFLPEFYEPITRNMITAMKSYFPSLNEKNVISKLESIYDDHDASKLIHSMDEANIKKAVLLLPDFTYCFRNGTLNIKDQIEKHISILKKNPDRFYLMAGIDPRWGNEGFKLFKGYAENNLIHGLKIYTPCGFSPNDVRMKSYYEFCTEKKLPVIFHTGPTSPIFSFKYSNVFDIDEVAYNYPELNIILAHGGIVDVEKAVELCSFRPNVYLDFSGYISSLNPKGSISALQQLFKRKINHKIIFGTDWPIGGYKNSYTNIVNLIFKPENNVLSSLSKNEIKMIFNENISNLLYF